MTSGSSFISGGRASTVSQPIMLAAMIALWGTARGLWTLGE